MEKALTAIVNGVETTFTAQQMTVAKFNADFVMCDADTRRKVWELLTTAMAMSAGKEGDLSECRQQMNDSIDEICAVAAKLT